MYEGVSSFRVSATIRLHEPDGVKALFSPRCATWMRFPPIPRAYVGFSTPTSIVCLDVDA